MVLKNKTTKRVKKTKKGKWLKLGAYDFRVDTSSGPPVRNQAILEVADAMVRSNVPLKHIRNTANALGGYVEIKLLPTNRSKK